MIWTSTSEMIKELGLKAHETDISGIKSEIRRELKSVHPDKTDGDFKTSNAREQFETLTAALEFLEAGGASSTALIRADQVTELVKSIAGSLSETTREDRIARKSEQVRRDRKTELARAYFLPRISSGVFASICALLATFSQTFGDHPILGKLARDPFAVVFVFLLSIMFGGFFIMTWMLERRAIERSEWLLTEDGLQYILREIANRAVDYRFTLTDWINEIRGRGRNESPRLPALWLLGGLRITSSSAEQIARMHLVLTSVKK